MNSYTTCNFCPWRGEHLFILSHVKDAHPKEWDKIHKQTVHELKGLFPSIEKTETAVEAPYGRREN